MNPRILELNSYAVKKPLFAVINIMRKMALSELCDANELLPSIIRFEKLLLTMVLRFVACLAK